MISIKKDILGEVGNLVNKTIGMINKYFDGIVKNTGVSEEIDDQLINEVLGLKDTIDNQINKLRIADSLESIMNVYRRCNKYIDETMPWVLAKEEDKKERLATVLYNLVESIRITTVYLQAYLPDTAKSIFKQINTDITDYDSISEFGIYPNNNNVGTPEVFFARIEKEK